MHEPGLQGPHLSGPGAHAGLLLRRRGGVPGRCSLGETEAWQRQLQGRQEVQRRRSLPCLGLPGEGVLCRTGAAWILHRAQCLGYMLHTQRFLHDIYAWCEDAELPTRRKCSSTWPGRSGHRIRRWGPTAGLARAASRVTPGERHVRVFPRRAVGESRPLRLQRLPVAERQVWEIALGRPQMGEYAFVSRKPGEARMSGRSRREPNTPCSSAPTRDGRDSWVTPDYVMGTRMDHPDAPYHHLGGEPKASPSRPGQRRRSSGADITWSSRIAAWL